MDESTVDDNMNKILSINLFDSIRLEDVKQYMPASILPPENQSMIEHEYFGLGERENLEKWNYPNFTYVVNSNGFRENSIPDKIDIGAFGCSYTFGQGLASDMLWHKVLGNNLNKQVYNFGVAGSSIMSIADIFCIVSKHIKMSHAVFLMPSYTRVQVAVTNKNKKTKYISAILSLNHNSRSVFAEALGFDEENFKKYIPDEELIKQAKNSIHLISHMGKLRGIKCYFSTWDLQTYHVLQRVVNSDALLPKWTSKYTVKGGLDSDLARDRRHPGPKHHIDFATEILPFVNNT
jgi:hypothetical protein